MVKYTNFLFRSRLGGNLPIEPGHLARLGEGKGKETDEWSVPCLVEETEGKPCLHGLAYHKSTPAMYLDLYGKHTALMEKAEALSLASLEVAEEEKSEGKPCSKDTPRYKTLSRALCNFLAEDVRPLNLVASKGFQKFVLTLDPRFRLPLEKSCKGHCMPCIWK